MEKIDIYQITESHTRFDDNCRELPPLPLTECWELDELDKYGSKVYLIVVDDLLYFAESIGNKIIIDPSPNNGINYPSIEIYNSYRE